MGNWHSSKDPEDLEDLVNLYYEDRSRSRHQRKKKSSLLVGGDKNI